MKLDSPWSPRLAEGDGSPVDRLVAALTEDIGSGHVAPGARLPAHRDLAWRLSVGLGTVTKAYANLERLGLVASARGRGMFVAGIAPRPIETIDLSVNVPPRLLADRVLAATLADLARTLDADTFGAYAPAAGLPEHRALMARRLGEFGLEVPGRRVILTNGAQHALAIALSATCPPGSVLITETATYPGALVWARRAGVEVAGVETDAEGLMPRALEEALARRARRGRPVVYLTPTLHNPTGATMGTARRRAIARLAEVHDAILIEDDVHAIFAPEGLTPIAALAPDRTLHVSGLSKALSPGVRIGALAVPEAFVEPALLGLQATSTTASMLACRIMERWLADGTARTVAAAIRADAERRRALVEAILPEDAVAPSAAGLHVWLPMTAEAAERFVARAAAAGVVLMPAAAPLADPRARMGGVRVCLGAPPIATLERALRVLADLFGREPQAAI